MMNIEALEWVAFGTALTSVLMYGQSRVAGAAIGIVAALTFIAWGLSVESAAAVTINAGFLVVNGFNLWRGMRA